MSGNYSTVRINQNRVRKSELADRGCDLVQLPLGMNPRVARIRNKAAEGLVTLLNEVRKKAAGGKSSSDRRAPSVHRRRAEASVRRG